MVSVACDAHWTRPMANHNTKLSIVMIDQATILHGLSTLKRYWVCAKVNIRLRPMGETLKCHIFLWIGSLLIEAGDIGILNIGTMISYGIEVVCPLRWSKGDVIMKSMAIVIPLMEFDIWFLELECVIWSHNKWDL